MQHTLQQPLLLSVAPLVRFEIQNKRSENRDTAARTYNLDSHEHMASGGKLLLNYRQDRRGKKKNKLKKIKYSLSLIPVLQRVSGNVYHVHF